MTTPAGTALGDVLRAIDAVNKWNDALRGSPNSLNKYVFHFNQNNDPNGNLIIHFVDAATVDQQCGTTNGDGCNDGQVAGMNDVWVDKGLESESLKLLIQHELGHSLWFTDQYSSNYTCVSTYTSVMDCDPITEATDEVDFRNHYKPTLQNPNPTYPDTWAATWSALYQVGEVDVRFAPSNVEWLYYWQRYTDTGARRRATVTRA